MSTATVSMSGTLSYQALVEPAQPAAPVRPMLVCVPEPGGGNEPLVVLADGSYESGGDRVFWREQRDREVLRLPVERPVAVRQLYRPDEAKTATGEQALLEALRASRTRETPPVRLLPPGPPVPDAREVGQESGQLSEALETADAFSARALAFLQWQEFGLASVYRTMSNALAQLASAWALGTGTVLSEHRATRASTEVAAHLRTLTPPPTRCGTVLLAVTPGDRHVLALVALAHLLEDAGWRVQVVEDLPVDELAELAADPGTLAVVLSVHVDVGAGTFRALLSALRAAAPEAFLVLGGPGAPSRGCSLGADLVTSDVQHLLQALEERSSTLTLREREVLLAVAEGQTNGEIAEHLRVAPATVKSHLDRIFAKTGTVHRAAAVAQALRQGWIQ